MPKAKNDVQDMNINDPPAKNFIKNDFLFQYFQTVNFGLFLGINHMFSTGNRP